MNTRPTDPDRGQRRLGDAFPKTLQFPTFGTPDKFDFGDIDWENSNPAVTRRAAEKTAEAVTHLAAAAEAAETRERQMLLWTKVSAVSAIVAAVVSLVAIVFTILAA